MWGAIGRFTAVFWVGISSLADAGGFRVSAQSAEYSAQGEISVNESGAASINYNPAGIAGLESQELSVGLTFSDQEVDGRLSSGGSLSKDSNWGASGNIFYAADFGDHHFGVGVYSPFGNSSSRGGGQQVLRAFENDIKLANPTISVVYARAYFEEHLYLGAAINYSELDLDFRQGLAIVDDSQLSFNAEDTSVNFTVGTQLHLGRHHLGLMYRSEAEYSLRGNAQASFLGGSEASVDLLTPAVIELGYKFEVNDRMHVGLEVEWQDWSQYGDLALENSPLGDLPFVFRWDDGYLVQAGGSYKVNDHRTLKLGYAFNKGVQNAMFYRPSLTDMDKDWFSFGLSENIENFLVHVSFLYGTGTENIDEGTSGDGAYDFTGKVFQLGISYRY